MTAERYECEKCDETWTPFGEAPNTGTGLCPACFMLTQTHIPLELRQNYAAAMREMGSMTLEEHRAFVASGGMAKLEAKYHFAELLAKYGLAR